MAAQSDDMVRQNIRQCITDLNMTQMELKGRRTMAEGIFAVPVCLVDYSKRRVWVGQGSTLKDVADALLEQLKITSTEHDQWGCFMMVDGFQGIDRPLPDDADIRGIQESLERFKEKTGMDTKLLVKRKVLHRSEAFNPRDVVYSTLTYRQALRDFLSYPMQEEPEDLITLIAANILWCDRGAHKEAIEQGQIEDVFKTLMPKIFYRVKGKPRRAKEVLEKYRELVCDGRDPFEKFLVSAHRAMKAMQKLQVYGSYHWIGQQNIQDVAFDDAPEKTYIINPRDEQAEYLIVVDYSGVKFIQQGLGKLGVAQNYSRQFFFSDEEVERVLYWGAKHDLLQLVVLSVDFVNPQRGRVPQSIVVKTPAAVDVAYTCQMINAMRADPEY